MSISSYSCDFKDCRYNLDGRCIADEDVSCEYKSFKELYKLRRCPFCGAMPSAGVEFCESSGLTVRLAAMVKCPICGVFKRKSFVATDLSLVSFDTYLDAFRLVVELWNTRTPEED